ncbi:hypothetical protein G7Z17_g10111 [Cylindrodendrum hubeiense]|uniref:Uncharacterized protein n=1 Tax=Cylindrodendrum hubeiense TaxID=595255 RepID=A0A9P5L7I8_9HYPO|nr:hypothetical protein G7Z17_g10111 [Cylindrodendrum hubeiense]
MVLSQRQSWAEDYGVAVDPIAAMYCVRDFEDWVCADVWTGCRRWDFEGDLAHSHAAAEVTSVFQSPSYDLASSPPLISRCWRHAAKQRRGQSAACLILGYAWAQVLAAGLVWPSRSSSKQPQAIKVLNITGANLSCQSWQHSAVKACEGLYGRALKLKLILLQFWIPLEPVSHVFASVITIEIRILQPQTAGTMYAAATLSLVWGFAAAAGATGLAPRQTDAATTTAATTTAAEPEVTAITGCHFHESSVYCFAGETEYLVDVTITATSDVPSQYTDCHAHDSEMYCVDSDGGDVAVEAEATETEEDHDHETETEDEHAHETETEEEHDHEAEEESESSSAGQSCHFHAGVEHCTGGDESESAESNCEAPSRDFNIGLRVGLLFVILATSAIGVFGPILLHKLMPSKLNLIFIVLKQFGTGIIVSTAFIHLYTHAFLMFGNECLGELGYEGTTSAVVMAGILLSFLVEFIGQRIVLAKAKSALSHGAKAKSLMSTEVVSILVMEAGILFHSLLIGLTLVVSGDAYFLTLFVVILFHQMFEGIALGSRIATIGTTADAETAPIARSSGETTPQDSDKAATPSDSASSDEPVTIIPTGLSMKKKLGLAALFAFITPIGMAIGIGVLQQFNGNNRSTLLAIGTLDALSAGILIWVGLVEMWAADWMVGPHGKKAELAEADVLTTTLAASGLIAGLILMSVLGKWA